VIVNDLTPAKGNKASSTAPATISKAVACLLRASIFIAMARPANASVVIGSQATRPRPKIPVGRRTSAIATTRNRNAVDHSAK
jgi:hypothetical protein